MVQNTILVVGSGRLAKHLTHFLSLKGFEYQTWSRTNNSDSLAEHANNFDVVLLAVSDGALSELARPLKNKTVIHFSGSQTLENAVGLHPLMTFASALYTETEYDRIPLVIDDVSFRPNWLTNLPNPKFFIRPDQKSLYHGLCHLAGNYPKFIWLEIAKIFENQLKIPPQILLPFLEEILKQSFSHNPDRHTGAFARKDMDTIHSHLSALENLTPLKTSYEAFFEAYREVNHDNT